MADLLHSPLDAEHRALEARMAEFGGWEMPIQYDSVLEEHLACRSGAVVFDVSHLGSVRVHGAGAFATLQWAFTNDLDRVGPGGAQYTHLLDPDDAHVVDDIIVWWAAPGDLLVMPNASNTAPLLAALQEAADERGGGECTLTDVTRDRAVLAVQGPTARAALRSVFPTVADVPRFGVRAVEIPIPSDGADAVGAELGAVAGYAAGTGYTGEDGIELHIPAHAAPAVWRAIVAAGVTPAGLGARDTLRLEAGLPLHGHELGDGITPLQAGLGWVVRWDKGDFRGRDALGAERERGITRRLRGLQVDGRQIPRQGCAVLVDGVAVGEVTSGNWSPVLQRGIALAFLDPDLPIGTAVQIDVRGREVPASVTKLPFVHR